MLMSTRFVCGSAAIADAQQCTSLGGSWRQAQCAVKSQQACTDHGGQWTAGTMWSLQGGVDLLIVGLLQV